MKLPDTHITGEPIVTDNAYEMEQVEQGTERPKRSWRSVSVFELFFLITCVALAIGLFTFISESLAILAAALILVVAATRFGAPHNPILAAVRGFAMAMVICWLLVWIHIGDQHLHFALIALLPSVGYVTGFVQSELLNQ